MVDLALTEALPGELRRRLDTELRREAFELLHGEAVREGLIAAPPRAAFDGPLGGLLRALLGVAAGAVIGLLAMLIVMLAFTSFPVPLP